MTTPTLPDRLLAFRDAAESTNDDEGNEGCATYVPVSLQTFRAAMEEAAALTREQREGDARKAALDELARENERLGLSYADAPQQEAPGAVLASALEHIARVAMGSRTRTTRMTWIAERAKSALAGNESWRDVPRPSNYHDMLDGPPQTTPPAPVDVRTRELALEGLDYFDKAGDEGDKKYVAAIRALLSGQPAGVGANDLAAVRMVAGMVYDAGGELKVSRTTQMKISELTLTRFDDHTDGSIVFKAALGGGGRG